MARFTVAFVAIFCVWFTHLSVCAQDLPESEEVAVEVDLLDDGETDAALWTPEFLSASSGVFTGLASQGHVYSNIDFAALSASDDAFQTDGDFVMTPRFQLGWESDSGWGVRGTYWEYDQEVSDQLASSATPLTDTSIDPYHLPGIHGDSDGFILLDNNTVYNFPLAGNDPIPIDSRILARNLETTDLEIYKRIISEQSRFLFGLGLRNVRNKRQMEYLFEAITFSDSMLYTGEASEESLAGTGITLVGEFNRPIFSGNNVSAAFVLGGRMSFVPATLEVNSELIDYNLDDDLWINEGNVGVELSRRLQRFVVRLRGQFETQAWNSSVMDDQAFTGVSTSLGVEW
jgi:hypothetical protein